MRRRNIVLATALFFVAQNGSAQARRVSVPSEPSLLNLTVSWARASTLGDLRDARFNGDDLELRVWRGYGSAETQATIIRRAQGAWSAWFARVIRCELQIPTNVGDTASATTMRGLAAEARRHCGQSAVDVAPGSRVIAADTLIVQNLSATAADIAAAWAEAQTLGVLQLPGRVERRPLRDDGVMLVIEVRRGDEYRATEVEEVDPPLVGVDSQVRQIYAALRRLRS